MGIDYSKVKSRYHDLSLELHRESSVWSHMRIIEFFQMEILLNGAEVFLRNSITIFTIQQKYGDRK